MTMKTLLEVGMLASLVMAIATPTIMPNIVLAQADIRQEDRQQDRLMHRQQDRREDRRADRGGRGRYGLSHRQTASGLSS